MSAVEVPAPASSRLRISEDLKSGAKGAVKTTVEVLGIAASTTQNVPYLSIISSVLTELLKIQDEVDTYKTDWKAVMAVARQIKAIVDRVHKQCEIGGHEDAALPDTLVEPLTELERCISKVLETMNASAAASTRRRDRVRTYLGRGELSNEVKQCRADMQAALDLFNTKLNIDGRFEMHAMKSILLEIRDRQPGVATAAQSFALLPAPPAIFHGRAREMDHIVDLIIYKTPARVAVLGSGGIGKTSIVLSVLHHPEVVKRFENWRYFLSCEAALKAEDVVQGLLKTFGVAHDPKSGVPPLTVLLSHLRRLPETILCLDNLETPWDADIEGTQDLLSQIAEILRVTLLVTTRGADRPMQVAWTRPFLPPVVPLTPEAALQTWDSICDSHDVCAVKLVEAVDCVPLAVTLFAHLAQSESSQRLWFRWEQEQTKLLSMRGASSRLSSVDVSIKLSLDGPRLQKDTESVILLGIICTLPQGMLDSRMLELEKVFADLLPNFNKSLTTLKQCSLLYSSDDGFLCVLSPIRHYIQAHHPISELLLARLGDIYRRVVSFCKDDFADDVAYFERNIRLEIGNIGSVLKLCLTSDKQHLTQTLTAVHNFTNLCARVNIYETMLLRQAIAIAKDDFSASRARLWQSMGRSLFYKSNYEDALAAFTNAVDLFRQEGDHVQEASSLTGQGQVLTHLGRAQEAEHALHQALEIYDEHAGIFQDQAYALHALGQMYRLIGRTDEALRSIQSSLDISRKIGYEVGEANCLSTLGGMYMSRKQFDNGRHLIQSAHDIYDRIGDKLGTANCLHTLGAWHSRLRLYTEAEKMLQSALAQHREVGDALGEANDLKSLADVYRCMRRYDDARAALETSRSLSGDIQYAVGQGNACLGLGRIHRDCGEFEEARRYFEDALRLYEQAQWTSNIARAQKAIANLAREAGRRSAV